MKILKKDSKIILTAINFLVPTISFAQSVRIINPFIAGSNLLEIVNLLLNNVVMPIGAVLVVIYIIYAGFTFVTAQGKEKEITEAKKRLLWALIGAGILLGAATISEVVRRTVEGLTTVG